MNKFLIQIFIYSNIITCAYSQDEVASRDKQILKLIDEEIHTIEKNPYSSAELSHRLFELKSEKIKVIREKETKEFIELKSKSINPALKNPNFKLSNELLIDTQNFASEIIKKYPTYQKINEIFYSMAINEREYGNNKQTEELLKKSIKSSTKDDKTIYFAKIALAENYYNNKQYSEAIGYYDEILKNKKNEWYGKHLYNASWCYLKNRQFTKSLNLLLESYNTSKDNKYISMRDQILTALPLFFVQADSTKEGILFIEKNIKPSTPTLINLAQSSMSKNNFQLTNEVLNAALNNAKLEKNVNLEIKVRQSQLSIFKESKKEELFFETAKKTVDLILSNKIDKDEKDHVINIIKEVAGFMQINLVKQKDKDAVSYKRTNFQKIIVYFDLLSQIDEQNSPQYAYYQGETSLSILEYKKAIDFYTKAILNSKKQKGINDYFTKSINSLLSSLELAKLKKKSEDHFIILALKNYLIYFPNSEKSQVFYQKLFSKYFEKEDIRKAINTLLVYMKNFSKDEKIHQEMLTQIIEHYIQKKNTKKLSFWVSKIESGYLNFKKEYIEKSIEILGGLLFQNFQELEKKGELTKASMGYKDIYDNKKYPKKVRADAAYALATILLSQNDPQNAFEWIKKSFEFFTKEDLQKISKSLYEASKTLRLFQKFNFSSDISKHYLLLNCEKRDIANSDFYTILQQNQILSKTNLKDYISTKNALEKCVKSEITINDTNHEMLESLIFNDKKEEIVFALKNISFQKNDYQEIGKYLKFKFWQTKTEDQIIGIDDLKSLSNNYPFLDLDSTIKKFEIINEHSQKVLQFKIEFSKKEKFNEELFNNELEQYFSIINKMNQNIYSLAKNSSPEEIIFLQNLLSSPYLKLMEAINYYTPSGVDSKYLDSFKKAMRPVIESLSSKVSNIESEKMTFLLKNHYFFELQKHVKFEFDKNEERNLLREEFLKHTAKIYSNSIDKIRN